MSDHKSLEEALLEALEDEDDSEENNGIQECRSQKTTSNSSPLAELNEAVLYRVLCCLSAEDLCALSCCSTTFHSLASDNVLWRWMYLKRWPKGQSEDEKGEDDDDQYAEIEADWKHIYARRDAQEVKEAVESAPEEQMATLFKQLATAKRSEPLGLSHIEKIIQRIEASKAVTGKQPAAAVLSARVAEFRRSHGLPTSPTPKLRCTCPRQQQKKYVRLDGSVWICDGCGHVHNCGEACKESRVDASTNMPVCPISGRTFARFMSEQEELAMDGGNHEEQKNGGAEDWNAEDNVGGRLGRAFYAGYNAADEREMLHRFGIKL